jgi:hypothetical protein
MKENLLKNKKILGTVNDNCVIPDKLRNIVWVEKYNHNRAATKVIAKTGNARKCFI